MASSSYMGYGKFIYAEQEGKQNIWVQMLTSTEMG